MSIEAVSTHVLDLRLMNNSPSSLVLLKMPHIGGGSFLMKEWKLLDMRGCHDLEMQQSWRIVLTESLEKMSIKT